MRADVPTTLAALIAPGVDTISAYVTFACLDLFVLRPAKFVG
jgi:hypothetical protein